MVSDFKAFKCVEFSSVEIKNWFLINSSNCKTNWMVFLKSDHREIFYQKLFALRQLIWQKKGFAVAKRMDTEILPPKKD